MIKRVLRKNIVSTHELSLVASLLAWGFSPIAIDKTDPKKVIFSFSGSQKLNSAVQTYWNDTGIVTPKKYFNALRDAKSRIYGG